MVVVTGTHEARSTDNKMPPHNSGGILFYLQTVLNQRQLQLCQRELP